MKKINYLVGFACMAVTALAFTSNVSAATGSVTLYDTYAFYEVDNRPYVTNLSMNCVYKYKDARNDIITENDSASIRGVYLTNRIDANAHYVSYYGNITWYLNGYYDGAHSVQR